MVLIRIQINNPPPLEPEVEGVFVEEEEVHSAETMTNEGYGLQDDKNKEEYLKIMKYLFYDLSNNINHQLMKGFEFFTS